MLKILLTASRGHSLEVNTAPRLSEKLHPPSGPLCSACCEALVSLHEISPLLGFIYKWLWVQNSVCKNFAQKKTKTKTTLSLSLPLAHAYAQSGGSICQHRHQGQETSGAPHPLATAGTRFPLFKCSLLCFPPFGSAYTQAEVPWLILDSSAKCTLTKCSMKCLYFNIQHVLSFSQLTQFVFYGT